MKNDRITRNSIIVSTMCCLLSVCLLIGTTFAWFTSDVTNSGNKIESGTLNIQLYKKAGGSYTDITNSATPVFDYSKWEPGYTASKELQLRTTGTLALRYQVVFSGLESLENETTKGIENVLDITINGSKRGTLADFTDKSHSVLSGTLIPQEDKTTVDLKVKIHMQESAGNQYQGAVLPAFDIKVNATQYTYEQDDVNYDQYDSSALPSFDLVAYQPINIVGDSVAETEIKSGNVTVTIPASALADNQPLTTDSTIQLVMKDVPDANPAFAVTAGTTNVKTIDISLKDQDGNAITASSDDKITVEFQIPAGMYEVVLLHNGVAMDSADYTYDFETGKMIVRTSSFSPYTVGYNTAEQVSRWTSIADTSWFDADSSTYTISNAVELAGLAKLANDKNTSFANKTILLDSDIDLSGKSWTPINGWSGIFDHTTFDGQGHTITGMNAYDDTACGFFGLLASSIDIKDLTLDKANVSTKPNKNQSYAGVLIAKSYSAVNLNNITVSNSKVLNNWQCGGIVGFAEINGAPVFTDCTVSDSFVGGNNATAGSLFGLGTVSITITGCTATNVKLFTDGMTWNSTQKTTGAFWVGYLYEDRQNVNTSLTVTNSTETNVVVVNTVD